MAPRRGPRLLDRAAQAHEREGAEPHHELHPEAKAVIAAWLQVMAPPWDETTFLFRSRKGPGAISRVQAWQILHDVYVSNGWDKQRLETHTLRKTFAARMLDELGGNVKQVQQALGHAHLSITDK